MLRILMLLEDYAELMFLQTILKKVGFDVDAIQTTQALEKGILSMNPDILLMTAYGKVIRGADIVKSVRKTRGVPRMILLRSAGTPEDSSLSVEGWLATPVSALELIQKIADVGGLDRAALSEKFNKMHMQELEEQKLRILKTTVDLPEPVEALAKPTVSTGVAPSTMSETDRLERYKKFLNETPPAQHGFAVRQVADQVRSLRRTETSADLEDLERERRAFVEHLFRKKGS